MFAYDLYPKLSLLTLTVEEADHWEDQLVFVGTEEQHKAAETLSNHLMYMHDGKYCG